MNLFNKILFCFNIDIQYPVFSSNETGLLKRGVISIIFSVHGQLLIESETYSLVFVLRVLSEQLGHFPGYVVFWSLCSVSSTLNVPWMF